MTELVTPVEIRSPDNELVATVTMGAAEGPGFATITLYRGDIINVRNIQGGTAEQPNLDIGAGSAEHRGDIVYNWDVGNGVRFFDGRKKEMFSVNKHNNRRVESQVPFYLHKGAYVPAGDGTWRKLT